MDTAQLLMEFSNLHSTPGREMSAHEFAKKQLEPYGKVSVSPTGNLICTVKEPKENQAHIMLDAHFDEIGFMVRFIEEDGFLRVSAAGGIDTRGVLSSLVNIHTKNHGILTGIVCSTPPHLLKGERENPTVDDLYIDTGLSGDAAKERIRLGDMITFRSHATKMLGNTVRGKSLDDRAGCVALLKALDYLGNDFNCGLSVVFSSMEEIGLVGATSAAFLVNPTHALAVDVNFAHTPDAKKSETSALGKGPVIGHAPLLNYDISICLENIAKAQNIPYQVEVMSRSTGTNADTIVKSRTGVRTALLSIPQRFMHTPNEVVSIDDIENTGKLIAAWIKDLGKGDA